MLQSPLRLLARLPAPVRLLITGTLINKVGTFIVPYLTIVLLREFRLSETEAARLLFAYGAGSIVSYEELLTFMRGSAVGRAPHAVHQAGRRKGQGRPRKRAQPASGRG